MHTAALWLIQKLLVYNCVNLKQNVWLFSHKNWAHCKLPASDEREKYNNIREENCAVRQNGSSVGRDVLVKDIKEGQDALTLKQGNLTSCPCFKRSVG